MVASTLLLLCDLYMKKQEVDSAFEILQEAWTELKKSASNSKLINKKVARCLCAVAARVLELIITSLPLPVRSSFDSVTGSHPLFIAHSIDPFYLLSIPTQRKYSGKWSRGRSMEGRCGLGQSPSLRRRYGP
jgi:hypothetical protein